MPLLQRKLKLTFCWIRIFSLSNSSFFFCVKTVSLILNHLRFSSSSAKRWLLRTNSPCSDFNSSVKSWYFAWYTWISLFTVTETKESHTRKSTAVLHVFGLKKIRVFELLSLSRKKKWSMNKSVLILYWAVFQTFQGLALHQWKYKFARTGSRFRHELHVKIKTF